MDQDFPLRNGTDERSARVPRVKEAIDPVRLAVRDEIAAIRPWDACERAHQTTALRWIDSGAGIYRISKPADPPMHLIAYFAVVDCGHILLVDHRNAQLWLPSGGHVEPYEHPIHTVRREAQEELAIAAEFLLTRPIMISVSETVGLTAGHTDVCLWYALRGDRTARIDYDLDEFLDARWFPISELPLERSDPHMSRFAQKLTSMENEFGRGVSN